MKPSQDAPAHAHTHARAHTHTHTHTHTRAHTHRRVGYGGVNCVVGCDGVGGVVGSGTCCAGFLLDTLIFRCEAAWLLETGSVRKKKMLSV
jgi:hypothetical protein